MRPRPRAPLLPLVLVALLAVWPSGAFWSASAEPCAAVEDVFVPRVAARDGTPFSVGVRLAPCLVASFDELRAWVGNETHQASRVHDGTAWVSSQGYQPMSVFATMETWLLIALRAAPEATHGGALVVAAEEAEVWIRLRGPGAAPASFQLGAIEWVAASAVEPRWAAAESPVVAVTAADGAVLGAAPAGIGGDGAPLPAGFAFVALPPGAPAGPAPPVRAGDVRLVRVAPALTPEGSMFELWIGENVPDLRGLRIASRGGVLALGDVPVARGDVVRFASVPDLVVAALAAHVPDLSLGETATFSWSADGAPVAVRTGRFSLAQAGGSLELVYGDVVLDSFAYGDGALPAVWSGPAVEATRISGRVFVRAWDAEGFVDTDTARDWERPRVHRQHQVDVPTRWFEVEGPARVFVCPDRCLEEFVLRVDGAVSSIDANVYELSHPVAVEALVSAAGRGVAVRVVVDERPVGAGAAQMDRIAAAVDRLHEAGVEVFAVGRDRFDVNHAKYAVVDGAWTIVLTENAVARGWPSDGASGNRGHGVAVRDAPLAAWTRAVFEADALHSNDARRVTGKDLHPDAQPVVSTVAPVVPREGRLPTLVLPGGFAVAPLLAPDHLGDPLRHPVAERIAGAREEVGFQQMNLPLSWRRPGHSEASPLASALAAAAARGVWVNGTLAGAFVEEGRDGNDQTAVTLTAMSPFMDVRLAGSPHPDGVLHAKTWWGDAGRDGGWLVVGSVNGNLASNAMNRELALVVMHPEAAAYVAAVAARDHATAQRGSDAAGADAAPAHAVPALHLFIVLVPLVLLLFRGGPRRPGAALRVR